MVAVAGFRVLHNLAWGNALYVDDLSTLRRRAAGARPRPARVVRGGGRAARLPQLHLDSGVGPEREDAHRLYLNTRLRITAHHFAGA